MDQAYRRPCTSSTVTRLPSKMLALQATEQQQQAVVFLSFLLLYEAMLCWAKMLLAANLLLQGCSHLASGRGKSDAFHCFTGRSGTWQFGCLSTKPRFVKANSLPLHCSTCYISSLHQIMTKFCKVKPRSFHKRWQTLLVP